MTPLTLSVTFAGLSGNIPLSNLDTNYGQLAGAINSVNQYAPYSSDTGAVNAYVLTYASPLAVSYADGLELTFSPSNTNTGASVVNVNSLGNKAITNPDGSALASGQLIAGESYRIVYKGTGFQIYSPVLVSVLGLPVSTHATLDLTDRGKCIQATGNTTVPNSVFFAGDAVAVYNNTASTIQLLASITTMRLAGTATTGARTIAARGLASIYFVGPSECVVSGNVS